MADGFREFDLVYWQMREALGYPIPDRIDRRFPRKLSGNDGHNPFACGKCEARRRFPGVNLAHDILELHDHLPPDQWIDVERRIRLAFHEIDSRLESPTPGDTEA